MRGAGQIAGRVTAELSGLSTSAKNELLFQHGINFNDVPAWQRRGTDLSWPEEEHVGVDPRTSGSVTTTRRRLHADDDLPMKADYRAQLAPCSPAPRLRR